MDASSPSPDGPREITGALGLGRNIRLSKPKGPPTPTKTRRNIYMGQEYLDMEAIVIQERKRTGRDISVADLIRKACREYVDGYWNVVARSPADLGLNHNITASQQ